MFISVCQAVLTLCVLHHGMRHGHQILEYARVQLVHLDLFCPVCVSRNVLRHLMTNENLNALENACTDMCYLI